MSSDSQASRQLLRHTVATLAYRAAKTVHNVPPDFSTFRIGSTSRTPTEILAHIGDLLEWALSIAKGLRIWRESPPLAWDQEIARFFEAMRKFDEYLASHEDLGSTAEKIFQGPIADALTHVGQIALLRRLAGAPVRGENYFKAEVIVGRVGPEQSGRREEFD